MGENSRLMNRNPGYASQWKGRILMQYDSFMADEVTLKSQAMEQ